MPFDRRYYHSLIWLYYKICKQLCWNMKVIMKYESTAYFLFYFPAKFAAFAHLFCLIFFPLILAQSRDFTKKKLATIRIETIKTVKWVGLSKSRVVDIANHLSITTLEWLFVEFFLLTRLVYFQSTKLVRKRKMRWAGERTAL